MYASVLAISIYEQLFVGKLPLFVKASDLFKVTEARDMQPKQRYMQLLQIDQRWKERICVSSLRLHTFAEAADAWKRGNDLPALIRQDEV